MKRIFIMLVSLLVLSSCATSVKYISMEQKYTEQWTGRSHSDIVSTFGAPDRVESDGLDGLILVYEKVTTVSEIKEKYSGVYNETVTTDKEYTHYFIGNDNRCYAVKSNEVEADPDSLKRSKRVFWTSYGVGCGALILLIGLLM